MRKILVDGVLFIKSYEAIPWLHIFGFPGCVLDGSIEAGKFVVENDLCWCRARQLS